MKLSVKDIDRNPSKKQKGSSKQKELKERAYVSNYLDAATSLTTGSRFSHGDRSAKTMKKHSQQSMQLDITTEVYMQYKKLAANIQTTNLLVEQLVAKPVVTKAKKKQRAYIDKKP